MKRSALEKRNISVFIASPGDLGPERERFRETISKLNDGFADGLGVKFEPLGWEDTLASSGRRSQGVINLEIDRCDVFILVLHRRWGQNAPDSAFSSYTEEEFHRALARMESEGSPEIFVFFKRVGPDSESDPGPQLAKVMAFRQSLEETRSFLYRYFTDLDSFETEVDQHLRSHAKGETQKRGESIAITPLPLNAIEEINRAKREAEIATARAESETARILEFALQTAEDAAEAAMEGNFEKARQRFATAISATTNLHILSLAFQFYYQTGDLDTALDVGERFQAATQPGSSNRLTAYRNLGNLHETRGELDEALEYYHKSLSIEEKSDHKQGMAKDYRSLGNLYESQNEIDQASAMFQKSFSIEQELRSEGNKIDDHSNRKDKNASKVEDLAKNRLYFNTLNMTEKRVLKGLARGKSMVQIATELNRSAKYLEQVLLLIRRKWSDTETIISRNQLLYIAGLIDIINIPLDD